MLQKISSRNYLGLLLLVFLISSGNVLADGSLCHQVFNMDAYFSLVNLGKSDDNYWYELQDSQVIEKMATNEEKPVFTNPFPKEDITRRAIFFNFCSPLVTKVKLDGVDKEICSKDQDPTMKNFPNFDAKAYSRLQYSIQPTTAKILDKQQYTFFPTCGPLLSSDSKFEYYSFKLIDEAKPQDGITYTLQNGDFYNETHQYNITFIIKCNKSESAFSIEGWKQVNNDIYLQGSSQYGCPTLEISKLWSILSDNKIIFTIIMILFGSAECFFGLKIFKPTLFIIGYLTGFGGVIAIMGEFVIRYDSESIMVYASLVIAILFGVLTGYVTVSLPKIGFFALGMWLGIILALLLNNAVLYKIQIGNTSIVLWLTIGILSVSMGLLSFFFYKHCVMICTGFIGAYFLIRPFGWIIGEFPNELQIAKELKYGTLTSVPNLFYLYLALILIVGAIGIRFQWSMYASRRRDEEREDLQLFIADPDFMDLNKSLLDKDDEDLTAKQIETKRKLERMQRNIEKEKKRQDIVLKAAEKLRKRQNGEDVSDDDQEDENSDDEYANQDEEDPKSRKKRKTQDLGLFSGIDRNESRKKSVKKGKLSQFQNSDDEEAGNNKQKKSKMIKSKPKSDSSDNTPTRNDAGGEKDQSNSKFAQMLNRFKGGNKKKEEEHEDPGLEMDDLSEDHTTKDQQKQQLSENENKNKSDSSDSEEEAKAKKKKNAGAKNAAKLAKSQKKQKK